MLPVGFGTWARTDLSNMKFLILALAVCAVSAQERGYKGFTSPVKPPQPPVLPPQVYQPKPVVKSVVSGSEAEAVVLRSDSEVNPDSFNFVYETNNGISAQSSGSLKRVGDIDTLAVQGQYEYPAPDGTPIKVSYIADENGYQPSSDILPVGPPMPEAIRRAVEYLLAHPPKTVEKY